MKKNHKNTDQHGLMKMGYRFIEGDQFWTPSEDRPHFLYSDGEQIEKYIHEAVSNTSDLSSHSAELNKFIKDWPSNYHLSPLRANLFRPFKSLLCGKILEVGAGCGAITRFLGECGGKVLALEGSPVRAAITASRCRDLENVSVIVESFHLLPATPTYDVVTLVGVLEYARKFFPSEDDGITSIINHAKSFLKPSGKLIIAIENQLGVKYFAGFGEDHVGIPMFGIEDRYNSNTAVTFGRAELENLLKLSGLRAQSWWYPFPDYKLPSVIVSDQALSMPFGERLYPVLAPAFLRDPQTPPFPLFMVDRALNLILRNELASDLANSFLVISSLEDEAFNLSHLDDGYHFAIERKPEYAKQVSFKITSSKTISVKQDLMFQGIKPSSLIPLKQKIDKTKPYFIDGVLWSLELRKILTTDGWSLSDICVWTQKWYDAFLLEAQISSARNTLTPAHLISGSFLDLTPQNMLVSKSGEAIFIDQEWSLEMPFELGYLVFRSIYMTMSSVGLVAPSNPDTPLDLMTLFKSIAQSLGLWFSRGDIERFISFESDLQQWVSGGKGYIVSEVVAYKLRVRPALELYKSVDEHRGLLESSVIERDSQIANLSQSVIERDSQIANLSQSVIERDSQIANLSQSVIERDSQIANLSQSVIERDSQIANLSQSVIERDSQIANLSQSVIERDSQIANLSQSVIERDSQIANLSQSISQNEVQYFCHKAELETAVWMKETESDGRVREIIKLQKELDDIFASRSWRLTSPFRKVVTLIKIGRIRVARAPLNFYRKLPLTAAQRLGVKNFLFQNFGPFFSMSQIYKSWKEYREIQSEWPVMLSTSDADPPTKSSNKLAKVDLPKANGTWEWVDYDAIKLRISQVKNGLLSQVTPMVPDMFSWSSKSYKSAAEKIRLPNLPSKPEVSIILPVFNNLNLTLECLLSISAHLDDRISFEIIVADDASTDETKKVLNEVANIRIIRNKKNLGFIRNCNNALNHVKGRYTLFLNNDVQVTKDWLLNLHGTFEEQSNVGAVGPKFIYPSGHLQEAGGALNYDGTSEMVGLNDDPSKSRYSYSRRVDYVSGACLMIPTELVKKLGGFSEEFLPCYCEDSDLCLRIQAEGYHVYYNPTSIIIHHLSKTTAVFDNQFKLNSVTANLVKLQQKWGGYLDKNVDPKLIAFYLPQFHPIPENDLWWGNGFTEWANVVKAEPNFLGHYQPRQPADLGFYDLRVQEVLQHQADLAKRYGIHGFCYYYYWFGGKRLLEKPIEKMLESGKPDMPFCLCWANENWTRRWDGRDSEILIGQSYSEEDDVAIINDLARYFRDQRYIRVDGRALLLVYRVTLLPDFNSTVARWRDICREQGIGEIYVVLVESMELVHRNQNPRDFGCDAAVEFPPLEMADQKMPSGEVINPDFNGMVADYRDIAVKFATREFPRYTRFKGVMPGWDNTARRQNNGFCFENATPGAFQAWLEESIHQTLLQHYGDERMVFINAWNEWAEGAYLEPDQRFGHAYLEAVKNALDASRLLRKAKYWHGN